VAGLRAAQGGDEGPLRAWFKVGYPALVAAIERCGCGTEVADAVATTAVDRALRFVRAGGEVRDELPWLARGIRNAWHDDGRRADADERRKDGLAATAPWWVEDPGMERDVRGGDPTERLGRICELILLLPSPYREALCWRYVERLPAPAVRAILRVWRHTGESGARHTLRRGRGGGWGRPQVVN